MIVIVTHILWTSVIRWNENTLLINVAPSGIKIFLFRRFIYFIYTIYTLRTSIVIHCRWVQPIMMSFEFRCHRWNHATMRTAMGVVLLKPQISLLSPYHSLNRTLAHDILTDRWICRIPIDCILFDLFYYVNCTQKAYKDTI